MPRFPLTADFYQPSALDVARGLLDAQLVRQRAGGEALAGIILETEAYMGESDLTCHAGLDIEQTDPIHH